MLIQLKQNKLIIFNKILVIAICISFFYYCNTLREKSVNRNKRFDNPIYKKILTNDSIKYWDALWGYGWCVGNDSSLLEYTYSYDDKRIFVDYNDIFVDSIKWKIKEDTLIKVFGLCTSYKYKIIKLTMDTLIVLDMRREWLRDTLFFTKSSDQISLPIEGSVLSPDTSKWPIKIIYK